MTDIDPKADLRWWKKDGDEVSDCMMSVVRRIRLYQDYRRTEYMLYASMYGGHQYLSFGSLAYMARTIMPRYQLSLNVVKSVVDSCVAKIVAKSRPKATFLTTGDWQLRRKARKMDEAVYGAMYLGGFYKSLRTTARDGMVYGSGFMKIIPNRERNGVRYERVLTPEILVDDGEGIYGEPRNMYQIRYIDRLVLADMFPEHEEHIMSLTREDEYELDVGYDATADQVIVSEGWHLPSGPAKLDDSGKPKNGDGSHCICVRGKVLMEEEWTRDRFPFAHFRWSDGLMGFYGDGLARELAGLQFEINEMLDELEEVSHGIKGKWFYDTRSNVNPDSLNDEATGEVAYDGVNGAQPPHYEQPNAIPQDTYNFLQWLRQMSFEQPGLSQLAATSQKPAGLNSGEAIRAYGDTQAERFLDKFQSVEEFVCEAASMTLEVLRELSEEKDGKFSIKTVSDGTLSEYDLEKIMLPPESFHLQIKPSSQMPTDLPGRLEFVQEMAKTELFDAEELMDLVTPDGVPDTEDLSKRKNATRRLVESMFDDLLEGKVLRAPEPEMDKQRALRVATDIYLESWNDGVPDDKLEHMRTWIAQCAKMIQAAQPKPVGPPAKPPGPMGPGAKPLPQAPPPGAMPSS